MLPVEARFVFEHLDTMSYLEDLSAQYPFSPQEDFKFKHDDGALLARNIFSRMPWQPRLQMFGARSTTNIIPDLRLDFLSMSMFS